MENYFVTFLLWSCDRAGLADSNVHRILTRQLLEILIRPKTVLPTRNSFVNFIFHFNLSG